MKIWRKTAAASAAIVLSLAAWAQFVPNMTPEALEKEIAAQIANGATIEAVLAAAQTAGVAVESFAAAAFKAGVPVASITTAVLLSAPDTSVALRALGQAFAADPAAIETVFKTAVTLPTVTIDPVTVASVIESGCRNDCLPTSVVDTAVANAGTPTTQPPAETSTTTTSTDTGGGGSGGVAPGSPT